MKFYAVIGEHALEFRSVVAEKRFYEQRGKPVIIEIDGQRQQNRQRQRRKPRSAGKSAPSRAYKPGPKAQALPMSKEAQIRALREQDAG
jgi:hypothetical protein